MKKNMGSMEKNEHAKDDVLKSVKILSMLLWKLTVLISSATIEAESCGTAVSTVNVSELYKCMF